MTAPIGSKANPSKYDILAKLAEDEPYFVIRADDVLSSALVELHAYIGAGQAGAVTKLPSVTAWSMGICAYSAPASRTSGAQAG